MPAHLEIGRVFACMVNAMSLSDYEYEVNNAEHSITVVLAEGEKIKCNVGQHA